MANLSVALASARTYLNDDPGSVWSDAALLPKAQEAHRELQSRLWKCGSPAVRSQTADSGIVITAGSVDMGGSLPADILTPFRMVEFGTAETMANATPMTERTFLPTIAQDTLLNYWAWREDKIVFLGATTDRKVILYYRKSIAIPAVSGDPIGILLGEMYIGARTAAMAHGSVGNKDAYDIITGIAESNFQLVVDAQRGQQSPTVRP